MTEKVALITGASKGIGAACAKKLSQSGYKVAIHFRSNPEEAEGLCQELPNSKAFQYDLSESSNCQKLINDVKKTWGRLDVLVNNAGMSIDQILPMAKPEDFNQLIDVNLKPTFLLSKFASRLMIRQRRGSIISVTSVVGHTGNIGQSMYAATKSAVTGFTKSIAKDLANYGIRCNTVAPGFIKTQMTDKLPEEVQQSILASIPMKRLGHSDDVANAVAFLCSEDSAYITGSTIHVNGGMYTN